MGQKGDVAQQSIKEYCREYGDLEGIIGNTLPKIEALELEGSGEE